MSDETAPSAVVLSPTEVDVIRERHVLENPEYHVGPRHCDWCWEDWPCDMANLLATYDDLMGRETAGAA